MLKSNFYNFKRILSKENVINKNLFKSFNFNKSFAKMAKFNYEDPLNIKSLYTEEETMVK